MTFTSKISNKVHSRTTLREVFISDDGAIDLASIMVGIIVIGIIGGVIAATVFAVIPWSQDNAAKGTLSAIQTSEGVQKVKDGGYVNSDQLIDQHLVSGDLANSLVHTQLDQDGNGNCYVAVTLSSSGNAYWVSDTQQTPIKWDGNVGDPCADVSAMVAQLQGQNPPAAGDDSAYYNQNVLAGASINYIAMQVPDNSQPALANTAYDFTGGQGSWIGQSDPYSTRHINDQGNAVGKLYVGNTLVGTFDQFAITQTSDDNHASYVTDAIQAGNIFLNPGQPVSVYKDLISGQGRIVYKDSTWTIPKGSDTQLSAMDLPGYNTGNHSYTSSTVGIGESANGVGSVTMSAGNLADVKGTSLDYLINLNSWGTDPDTGLPYGSDVNVKSDVYYSATGNDADYVKVGSQLNGDIQYYPNNPIPFEVYDNDQLNVPSGAESGAGTWKFVSTVQTGDIYTFTGSVSFNSGH